MILRGPVNIYMQSFKSEIHIKTWHFYADVTIAAIIVITITMDSAKKKN